MSTLFDEIVHAVVGHFKYIKKKKNAQKIRENVVIDLKKSMLT